MRTKVGAGPVGPPLLGRQGVDSGQELGHRHERTLCIGVVDGGELGQPRRVDPDRRGGMRRQRVIVSLQVDITDFNRSVPRRQLQLSFDPIVMVMVERRAQEIERQHQYEQPPRNPPCAAHTAPRRRVRVNG